MASKRSRSLVCAFIGVVAPPLGFACAGDRFGELDIRDAASAATPSTSGLSETGTSTPSPAGDVEAREANPDTTSSSTSDALPPMRDAATGSDAGADAIWAPSSSPPPTDASSDTSGETASGASASDAAASACDFDGTWASRLTIDVTWVPQGLMGAILAPGSGKIEQWILSTRVTSGTTTTDTALLCGIALPDFSGTQIAGSEKYGILFPSAPFDSGILPSFTITGSIAGSGAGATFDSAPIAVLLGLTLPNPTTDPWPSTIGSPVDSDHDGKPGVTVLVAQGSGYSDVIVDTVGDRADALYVAMRQVTSVTATAMDCDSFAGTVAIPQITDDTGATKYAIDSHVIGCRLDVDAGDCYAVQGAFVDATQPVFTPSGKTAFTSVRVANGTTCSTVRQKLP